MAKSIAQLKHPLVKVIGNFSVDNTFLISAKITEGLSILPSARIVFATKDSKLGLDKLLGTKITLDLETLNEKTRHFYGTCIEAEYLGIAQGYDMFAVETRPWLWFLTQAVNTRIFQDMTTTDIIKQVCADLGFSDLRFQVTGTNAVRGYCVQYDETDFDFISRLMEEEGIYYFFDHSGTVEKMVITDSVGAHEPIKETPVLEFKPRVQKGRRFLDHVYEWSDKQKVVTGKVSLIDYEPLTPNTKLSATTILKKGTHTLNDIEVYSMGGHYTTPAAGEGYTKVRAERAAHEYERWTGAGNARTLAAGATFKLKDHPRVTGDNDFLIVMAEHYFQIEVDADGGEMEQFVINEGLTFPGNDDLYFCRFEVIRKAVPFRPRAVTPWPDLSGMHTAVVTGPSGEEIYTDVHGRVKVQFHWDRKGKHDDKTTCWCRVAHPWTGKSWGMQAIPRIGQEVIIMFERNNPDRPVIIGMLYNAVNTLPYTLPDNMTQTGVKTNSSKGGGGFNEFVMEDKKGEEFVRLQSEKDFFEIIKNNAKITIGLEKKDAGTLSETVHGDVTETYNNNHTYKLQHNLTETIVEGDHNFTIEKGNRYLYLKEGNNDIELDKGGMQAWLHEGDYDIFVDKGGMQVQIKDGDYNTFVDKGKMYVKVSDEIKFECGASSITMKKNGDITIKGNNITIDGSGNVKAKAALNLDAEASISATVKGSVSGTLDGGSITTVKGALVKIN